MGDFRAPRVLGRTGLMVGRLGIGSSYGVPARAIERAFHEYGVNYLYWGSLRRGAMAEAIRNLARTARDRIVVVLQSYDRTGVLMPILHRRGLRRLGIEQADVLLLGWHNRPPSRRLLDAALRLKEQGLARFLAISGHQRTMFAEMARTGSPFDVFMFRYNAAHRGAEREIVPHLPADDRPGTVAYTATRWGHLLDPRRMPAGERPLTASECYRFVLTNPAVDVCLTGPADEQQMDEALRALDGGPMTERELEHARRVGDIVYGQSKWMAGEKRRWLK